MTSPVISVIMGSKSDLRIMQAVADFLADLNVPHEVKIVSAHRTPDYMFSHAREASSRGIQVIIAGAGGAAHLPGMVASLTHLPVIGVPINTTSMGGSDSLYSVVQMPSGVPVATMAIDGARNSAIFACQILALHDEVLRQKLYDLRLRNAEKILLESEVR